MDTLTLLGSTLGLSLTAGFRLYATVLAVGLGIRFHWIALHPDLAELRVLANGYVLAAAALAYLAEFFADKIPWVDSLWDSLHTFIRPLGAAFLAAAAWGHLDPAAKWVVVLLCGGVALTGHSTKAGARLAVNHSPEPFSNLALSLLEDALAVFGVWLALAHPLLMLALVLLFLALFLWLSPKIFRLMRVHLLALLALLRRYVLRSQAPAATALRCAAGKGVKGLRNSVGWLCLSDQRLLFHTRRWFRLREHAIDLHSIRSVQHTRRLLTDRLTLQTNTGPQHFHLFKDASPGALLERLRRP